MKKITNYPAKGQGSYEFCVEEKQNETRWLSRHKMTTPQAMGVALLLTFPFVIMLIVLPAMHPTYLQVDCNSVQCTYRKLNFSPLEIGRTAWLKAPIDQMGMPRVTEEIVDDEDGGFMKTAWYITFNGKEYKVKAGDAAKAPGEAMVRSFNSQTETAPTFFYREFNLLFLIAQLFSWVPLFVGLFIGYLTIKKRPRSALLIHFSPDFIAVSEYNFWGKRLHEKSLKRTQIKRIECVYSEGQNGPEFCAKARLKEGPAVILTPPLHFTNFDSDENTGKTLFKQMIKAVEQS